MIASAISTCQEARTLPQSISSSRVKIQRTGLRVLSASSAAHGSLAESTLPPKPPPTVPPTSLRLPGVRWRCSASTPIVKYIACVQV